MFLERKLGHPFLEGKVGQRVQNLLQITKDDGRRGKTVKMWDGEYAVGLQHLKSFNYLPQECQQMQVICDRLARIYSDSLEETVKSLLQLLGKVNRPYLTELEEKLLSLLESEVKV